MKKVVLACLTAGLVSSLTASAATVKFSDGPGNTGGGEFLADVGVNGSVDFRTFCLEYNENIAMGTTYVYEVSDAARFNGNGTLDKLSKGAAWLYSLYSAGTLAGYEFSTAQVAQAERANDANMLQRAFWFLEDEAGGNNQTTANNSFLAMAANMFGSLVNAKQDNNGMFGVAVMNLWEVDNRGNRIARQDQLIRVPDGGTTLVFLGMAMTGLAAANRRFRKN